MSPQSRDEVHLQLAVRIANIGLWDWDLSTHRVVFSAEWKRQLGYAEAEISDEFSEWESRVHPADLPGMKKKIADYLAVPRSGYEAEFRMRHKDGSWRWILSQADLLRDDQGRPMHMIGSHIDITERKRAEEARITDDHFFRQLDRVNRAIQGAEDVERMMIAVLDTVLSIFECDRACLVYPCDPEAPSFRVMMERNRPDYPGDGTWGIDLPMDADAAASMRIVKATDGPVRFDPESVYPLPASGSKRSGFLSMIEMALAPKTGNLWAFGLHQCAYARVWTEREERLFKEIGRRLTDGLTGLLAHRNLQEVNHRVVEILEGITDMFTAFDREWRITYVNERAAQGIGKPREELLGRCIWDLFPEQKGGEGHRHCLRAMTEGVPVHYESWVPRLEGWRENQVYPTKDGISIYSRDITERKASEKQLALVSFALNRVREAAYLIDEHSRFLYVNDESCRALGYRREELLRLNMSDVGLDFPRDRWSRHWDELKRAGSLTFEMLHQAKDGQAFPVEVTANYFEYDGIGYNLALVRDITHRKEAEAALRESEHRFRQVTENIDEVFWLTDVGNRRMIYISPAYEKVWGRTCESLYADPRSWMEAIHPEDRERIGVETLRSHDGAGYDVEYRILRPDDTVVRWIQDRAFPVKDGDGAVQRMAGVASDITVRRQLEDQFRQAQKMDAIGQLAGGIAHDFNNLLAVIQMQSSFLLGGPADSAYLKEGIQQIMAASERAANLTRQLLTFSRRGVTQVKVMDLGEVTDHMVKLLARLIGENITLKTHFDTPLPLINADPGMMEQVLMNLAVNARDAMAGGGEVGISVDARMIGPGAVPSRTQAVPGEYVRLSVSDTGCGIAPENLTRIFEPFFTTKEVGKGTGLGLATVFGIVEQHHGWIEVASEVNRGTTFNVFLPALPRDASAPPPGAGHKPHAGGDETVLLVEDESDVRMLARMVLERYGYRVLEASSASEAIRCWETHDGRIDLLLTDLIMPGGVSGWELAEQLTRHQPGLKVVYTSGYNPEVTNACPSAETGRNFLQKPYSVSDLAAIMRRNLDKA